MPVDGGDRAAISLHDLPADRETETRMLAEMLGRPLGVEALENRLEIVFGNARSLVVDRHDKRPAARFTAELHHDPRSWWAERERVVDYVAKHLAVAAVVAVCGERRIGRDAEVDRHARLVGRRG